MCEKEGEVKIKFEKRENAKKKKIDGKFEK